MKVDKIVKTEDVSLKTLQVQIEALTINGKQVTLSMFRQIPARQLEHNQSEKKIMGTLWGHVNYHWGKQSTDNLHVLWQEGDRLYRCLICPYGFKDECKYIEDELTALPQLFIAV